MKMNSELVKQQILLQLKENDQPQEPDRLYFYSKSADKPPGKGVNEFVNDPQKYKRLANILNWRKMLSNFWVAPFTIDEIKWNTVEHYYQAQKLLIGGAYNLFKNLQFDGELGQGNGWVAQRHRKAVILSSKQLQQWNDIKDDILYDALYAKFSQNINLYHLLLATNDAELWHGTRGVPKTEQFLLQKVRRILKELKL